MLILSRNERQRVTITTPEGRKIVVILVEGRPRYARLGFEADQDVTIMREELEDGPKLRPFAKEGRS